MKLGCNRSSLLFGSMVTNQNLEELGAGTLNYDRKFYQVKIFLETTKFWDRDFSVDVNEEAVSFAESMLMELCHQEADSKMESYMQIWIFGKWSQSI